MSPTNAEYRPRSFLNYLKQASQRAPGVLIPRVALAAKNNMRRLKRLDALRRNSVEGLSYYLEALTHAAEDCSQFAWTCALTVKRVVDEIYQQIKLCPTNFSLSDYFRR